MMGAVHSQAATHPLKRLTSEQVDAYQRNGFTFPVSAMSESEAAECRARLESYEAEHGLIMGTALRNKPHLVFTWINELIRDPRIVDVVEDILGPNILVWGSNFFIKDAHDPAYISWHQDSTYWGLSHPDVMTAWIALSDVTIENGAMRMLPGSHLIDQLPHVDTFADNNLLTRGQEVQVDVDEDKAVDVPLKPGDMSLHHVRIVHGSNPNPTETRRIGLAIRYVPTYVSQISGARDYATLVRGEDTYHNFQLEPSPKVDFGADEMALHAKISEESFRMLYKGTDHILSGTTDGQAPT
jgi:ectoine hydroxylase-related dioxygenase (phytanoyl-CoA dioxygenase family)